MGGHSIDMQCWRCGIELKNILLPFSKYEECSSCKTDLHSCLGCKSYSPGMADACSEDRADFIVDKDKANFCDFFRADPSAYKPQDNSEAAEAKRKLAALFGEELAENPDAATATPVKNTDEESAISEADKALAELNRLFSADSSKD